MRMNKKSEHDFKISDLPQNRKEVFRDCLRMRRGIILALGGMCVLFAIPLLTALMLRDFNLSSVLIEEGEQGYSLFYAINFTYAVIMVPCFIIFGIGLSGVMYIIRQLIWYEGLFFLSDFFEGIGKNWKAYVFSFLAIGIYNVELTMLSHRSVSEMWYGVYLGVGLLLLLPIVIFVLLMSLIYKFSFTGSIRNGFLLYMRSIPKTLLAALCVCMPFLAFGIVNVIFRYIVLMVLLLVLLPPILIAVTLYGFSLFDKYINKEQYPQLVNKGVFTPE